MAARLADVEATRGRLLADLGRELRTPVATIEAYVDAAEDSVLFLLSHELVTQLATKIAAFAFGAARRLAARTLPPLPLELAGAAPVRSRTR